MEALDFAVLKKEKWVSGEEAASRWMMEKSGAAWVPKGKAQTATWGSAVALAVVGGMAGLRK